MIRRTLLTIVAAVATGCTAAPAGTPITIYVTPEPTVTTRPTEPTSTVTPTLAQTASPTASPAVASTLTPIPQSTPLTLQDELTLPGSLDVDLDTFTSLWNGSLEQGDGLTIRPARWEIEEQSGGTAIAQQYFSSSDDAYDQFGLLAAINSDESLRAAVVLYVPSNSSEVDASYERLIAIFAHYSLLEAAAAHLSQEERNAVIEFLWPPVDVELTGVEAVTQVEGVRIRFTDQGSRGILLIVREDNVGTAGPQPTLPSAISSFGDGIHAVGADIEPGIYRLRQPAEQCYWARLSDFSGELDDIIANENVFDGYAVVNIESTDAGFESSGCGLWSNDPAPVLPAGSPLPNGTFIVGHDFEPGRYRSSAGEACYWARLSGFSGELDDIIANDNVSGPTIVTINLADVGFTSSGCGTWAPAD